MDEKKDLICEIKQRLDAFLNELSYLNEEQIQALAGLIPMTQKIFDSIMERRDEVGPMLEDLWLDVFLKYSEFAVVYTERLEAELGISSNEKESPVAAPDKSEQAWIRFKKMIKDQYGDNI